MAKRNNGVKDGNYYTVQSFMVKDLHLKGNELAIYAIIYGFTQDGEHYFNGGIQYLADWLSTSRQCVINNLKALVDKGLIDRQEQNINGVKFVNYRSTFLTGGSQESLQGGSQESLPRNIKSSINKEIINIWNSLPDLPKIQKISGARETHLNRRIEEYGSEEVIKVIQSIADSDFLLGKNNQGWCVTFDWLIKDSNFKKVAEGNYRNRKKSDKLESAPTYDLEQIKQYALNNTEI